MENGSSVCVYACMNVAYFAGIACHSTNTCHEIVCIIALSLTINIFTSFPLWLDARQSF